MYWKEYNITISNRSEGFPVLPGNKNEIGVPRRVRRGLQVQQMACLGYLAVRMDFGSDFHRSKLKCAAI